MLFYCILLHIKFLYRVCFTCSTCVFSIEDFFHGTGCCTWQSSSVVDFNFQVVFVSYCPSHFLFSSKSSPILPFLLQYLKIPRVSKLSNAFIWSFKYQLLLSETLHPSLILIQLSVLYVCIKYEIVYFFLLVQYALFRLSFSCFPVGSDFLSLSHQRVLTR